ncbi:hypothetical protein SAV14893_063120 [Streptomyces avermitilis]|uniref:Uncharacterized protein n=1 Tax=Streptomyces avermitilis TaxID=33903 RepID=A0A4D4M5K1_STRAX|nr:hypothetical protein SAV14893_063120 [Streptomyces avermitilis]
MERGLRARHEDVAEVGDLGAQARVGAERGRQVVESGVPVVVLVFDVRLGEDHVLGDLAQLGADTGRDQRLALG